LYDAGAGAALRTNFVWCCLNFVRDYLGHPDCWDDEFSYSSCCLLPGNVGGEAGGSAAASEEEMRHAGHGASLTPPPVASRSLGYVPGVQAGRRHFDIHHAKLREVELFRGCEGAAWDEILLALKIKGGCLPCSTPPGELEQYFAFVHFAGDDRCRAALLVLAISMFLSVPEERVGEPSAAVASTREDALRLLARTEVELGRVEGDAKGEEMFFDVFGFTAAQARYMLLHTSLREDYAPIYDYGTGIADGTPRLVFDLGMSGGMDSLFYLVHGFRVVAVEPNPLLVLDVRSALSRYGDRFRVVNAVVIDEAETWRRPSASSATRLAPENAVEFYIHRERPDFSALDGSRVPKLQRAGTMLVRTLTCADLVATHGRPFGVKIDAEGADRACLTSLRHADAAPPYVSAEMPSVIKEGSEPALALLALLLEMGYTEFKLCRQSLYNARLVVAVDQTTNQSNMMASRQGLGLGASGPFGEAAVDWIAGPRWRPAQFLAQELGYGGPVWVASTMNEWFDIHAKLGE